MYQIKMTITHLNACEWYGFYLEHSDVESFIIKLLEMKLDRISNLIILDPESRESTVISKTFSGFFLKLGDDTFPVCSSTTELIVSFLLDQTNIFCGYDHIDFEISNEARTVEITIKVIRS